MHYVTVYVSDVYGGCGNHRRNRSYHIIRRRNHYRWRSNGREVLDKVLQKQKEMSLLLSPILDSFFCKL